MAKKRLLTGLQPSGALHIANFYGALRPFIEMYEKYDSFLMVADYHALTTVKNPTELRKNTIETVKDYLAVGVDPQKAVIFRQSDVLEHMELAWILECLITVPFLMQSHAYKDKIAKGLEPNAGLFNYPMLMAADILLYDTDTVPVGEDQRQHVEYAREAATKFNNTYGPTFKEPREHILQITGTVPGTDNRKMSKAYGNTIPLFGTNEEIKSSVMSIVTDSTPAHDPKSFMSPVIRNIQTSASVYLSPEEATRLAEESALKPYRESKETLIQTLHTWIDPMREKRDAISDEDVKDVLAKGAKTARTLAEEKMQTVREKIGISL